MAVAVAAHVVVERVMIGLHRWGDAPGHPVIPFLDVGVLVFLQPLVLVPLLFSARAMWEVCASPRRFR